MQHDTPTGAAAARAEGRRRLWAMTPAQRADAMWAGELSWDQLFAWARRTPGEVPLVNGEFAFIAVLTPELAEDPRAALEDGPDDVAET